MSSKLNWLIQNSAPGMLVLQSWLTSHNISPQLAQKYSSSGWLEKLRAGVYFRPGRLPEWQDAVHCLKSQLNEPVHISGLTSLTYQGRAHYIQAQELFVWLAVNSKSSLPLWFKQFPSDSLLSNQGEEFPKDYYERQSHKPQWRITTNNSLAIYEESDLIDLEVHGLKIPASCQELATFELLNTVPQTISFEHAADIFQGLVNLRPDKVQSVLRRSNSVKTNRLFLFFTHYYKHSWVDQLDEFKVNLGSGKRQVVKGGVLDKDYQITVPRQFSVSCVPFDQP